MNTFTVMLSLIACTLIVGCGKQTGDTDTKVKQTDTATAQAGSGDQLPKNFPADVYVPQHANIFTAYTTPESTMVGFDTVDSVKTATDAYITNMLKNGWTKKTLLDQAEISMTSFSKDERNATVIISSEDAKIQISLTLTTSSTL